MEQKTKHQDEMVNAQQDMQGQEQVQKQGAEQAQGHEEAQSQEQGIKAKKREGAGGAAQRGAVGQEFQADRAKNGPARAKGNRKPNSSKKMPAKPETGKEVKANPQKDKAAVEQYAQSKGDKTAASVKEGNDVDKAEEKKDNKAVALKDDKAAAKKDDKA
ncbi:MAG: hypothetical protein J6S69_01715, partial [Proteobacteria bacterium]|nr:hypothetical protein [Pseudomonadota bacterium]